MKRQENLKRLSSLDIDEDSSFFLHYTSYHKALKNVIQKYSKGSLLDIGCGNKPYEGLFEEVSTSYLGCDVIQSNLNKVDLICEANNIPLENCSFETVFSSQVIEHVEDHQGLVDEAFRLLKPDGYFILSGPFTWPLHEEPYDFFRFSKHGFKYILEKSGFEVVEIIPNGGMWANAGLSLIHALESTSAKSFKMRVVMSFYYRLKLRRLINKLFNRLDKNYFNEFNTINYVVIAKKN